MTAALILARTVRDGECLIWQGAVQTSGYGSVTGGRKGFTLLAHRAIYMATVGPIPVGLTIDHLCMVKLCMNVDHMEVVTRGENSRRKLAAQTHCKDGHAITGDNLRLQERANGLTYRICVECSQKYRREYMRRVRAVNVPVGTFFGERVAS